MEQSFGLIGYVARIVTELLPIMGTPRKSGRQRGEQTGVGLVFPHIDSKSGLEHRSHAGTLVYVDILAISGEAR